MKGSRGFPEENDGKSVTETAGARTAHQQIAEIIGAGMRLAEYRREHYDIGPDDEVGDPDN